MRRTRIVGAGLAALVAAAIVVIGWRLESGAGRGNGPSLGMLSLTSLGLTGAPIVAWLGWQLAPAAATGTRGQALGRAMAMAVLAVVIGSFAVVGLNVLSTATDLGSLVASLPLVALLGLLGIFVLGPIAFGVTLPAALVWMALLRLMGPRVPLVPRDPVAP